MQTGFWTKQWSKLTLWLVSLSRWGVWMSGLPLAPRPSQRCWSV